MPVLTDDGFGKQWFNKRAGGTPVEADAIMDFGQRIGTETTAKVGGTIIRPEKYGAAGDGVTDDTAAIQAAIDAAIAADDGATVQLGPKTYIVDGAPRTDRTGNSILSITDAWKSQKKIRIRGYGVGAASTETYLGRPIAGKTIIKTTRTTDAYASGPSTTLTAQLLSGATSASVTNVSTWPTSGFFVCENEVIRYTGKTGSTTLTGLTRGQIGTTAATHANGSTVQITYGAPSVIGAATLENGLAAGWTGDPTTDQTNWIGTCRFEDFVVKVPLDPKIAGLDLYAVDGCDAKEVIVIGGTGGNAVAAPTHSWAFGFRWPGRWGNGIKRSQQCTAIQMYVGHAEIQPDHHVVIQDQSIRCTLAYGFEKSSGDLSPFGYPGGVYGMQVNYFGGWACVNTIAGWSPQSGVQDVGFEIYIHNAVIGVEDSPAPFTNAAFLKDANNLVMGNITKHYYSGINVSGPNFPATTGGQRLKMRAARTQQLTPFQLASAATIAVPPDIDTAQVTGSTAVTSITASYPDRVVRLLGSPGAPVITSGGNLTLQSDFKAISGSVLTLVSDGTNWIEASRSSPWQAFTPTLTGWSADPTATMYRYLQEGKKVTVQINQQTNGTSNATTKTLTLPVPAATLTNASWQSMCTATDNGAALTAPSIAAVSSGGTIVNFHKTPGVIGGWTASGAHKIGACTLVYESA